MMHIAFGGYAYMMFEGEINQELFMLVYFFCIIIVLYVVVALVLYVGHRKAWAYEQRKKEEQLKKIMNHR